MQETQPELELAQAAAAGDEAAWRQIYDLSSDRLFSFLCYQVGDREEALDLLQETFLKAHRSLRSYRGEAPLSAWLRKIALHLAMDWKRSVLKKLKRRVALDEVNAKVEPDIDHVRFESEYTQLSRALEKLSPNQRAVLLMHDWETWSFAEISGALGCKESTVRVHHARAREKMKVALSGELSRIETDGLEGQKV